LFLFPDPKLSNHPFKEENAMLSPQMMLMNLGTFWMKGDLAYIRGEKKVWKKVFLIKTFAT
jgi:hypothetical protein